MRTFTLIELLVVITIIVVLLAMLTPALDSAIYRAEIVSCGANLKGIGTGALNYAMNNDRVYPARAHSEPDMLFGAFDDPSEDRRPIIRPYISIANGLLQDPMTERVDLDDTDSTVWTAYGLWFGFKYEGERGGAGMIRIGNKLTFVGPDNERRRFALLAADEDQIETGLAMALGAHPDKDGIMTNEPWHSRITITGSEDMGSGPAGAGSPSHTSSKWIARGTQAHGFMDVNAVYDDNSVALWDDMAWDAGKPGNDDRFTAVAIDNNGGIDEGDDPGVYLNLPVK